MKGYRAPPILPTPDYTVHTTAPVHWFAITKPCTVDAMQVQTWNAKIICRQCGLAKCAEYVCFHFLFEIKNCLKKASLNIFFFMSTTMYWSFPCLNMECKNSYNSKKKLNRFDRFFTVSHTTRCIVLFSRLCFNQNGWFKPKIKIHRLDIRDR